MQEQRVVYQSQSFRRVVGVPERNVNRRITRDTSFAIRPLFLRQGKAVDGFACAMNLPLAAMNYWIKKSSRYTFFGGDLCEGSNIIRAVEHYAAYLKATNRDDRQYRELAESLAGTSPA